jgi:hypothetical protein
MDSTETEYEDVNWTQLLQDRVNWRVESSCSVKERKLIYQLSNYHISKTDCAPWSKLLVCMYE